MVSKTAIILTLCRLGDVTAELLRLKLEPAVDFHDATDCCDDLLYFQIVEPEAQNSCTVQSDPVSAETTVCGGSFPVDLAQYDGIEFSFEAPEGKEIHIQSESRVRVEFQATADCDSDAFFDIGGSEITVSFTGSDVGELTSAWNPSNSFVDLGKCAVGCSVCEIFTRIELSGALNGFMSGVSWTIDYNPSAFADVGSLNFSYDTAGYCWIRTPFEDAIVGSSASEPTSSPTANPTSQAARGFLNSWTKMTVGLATMFVALAFGVHE